MKNKFLKNNSKENTSDLIIKTFELIITEKFTF